jgi:hypothetical protein
VPYLLAVTCFKEHGCPSESNVFGIVFIVALIVAVAGAIAAWAWFRWERGPFPLMMRAVGMRIGKYK